MEWLSSVGGFSLFMDHHINSPASTVVFVWGPMSLPHSFPGLRLGEGAWEWEESKKTLTKIVKEEKAFLES